MPKIDWSTTVKPFVEKYGNKFYEKFMALPDYIKGHMNPKEKEVFIKEGKPAIKRYTLGNGNVFSNFAAGRGRIPYGYEGVYTSTAPVGYDTDYYGDYQFKLPWSREEFLDQQRIVADPRMDKMSHPAELDGVDMMDPERSVSFGSVRGPIGRIELVQKKDSGRKLAEASGLSYPNGKPQLVGTDFEHTTDFGGRTDVMDKIPPENMFLDSLATNAGRDMMKTNRLYEIASGVKNGTPGFGFADDVFPIRDYFNNPYYANAPKISNAVNNAISEKYGSISNMLRETSRNPSEYETVLDGVAKELKTRMDMGERDILPFPDQLDESQIQDALRNHVKNYANDAFTFRFDPKYLAEYEASDDLLKLTTHPKRYESQLKIIDDIDRHANTSNRRDMGRAEYSERTRRLGGKALNEFGYVPEYFVAYDIDNRPSSSATMRFLLPDEPDRPIFKGERILDMDAYRSAGERARTRQLESAYNMPRTPKIFDLMKSPDHFVEYIQTHPTDKTIANLVSDLQNTKGTTAEINRKYDELAKRLYDSASKILKDRGINIDDDISRELFNLVNDRIAVYREGRASLPDSY